MLRGRFGIEGGLKGDLLDNLAKLHDSSQACILTFDVLARFIRDELIRSVDEVLRILQLGGRSIIHVPHGESPLAGRARYWDLTQKLAFTRMTIAQLKYVSGFSDGRSFEDGPIPQRVKSLVRCLLWTGTRTSMRIYIVVKTSYVGQDAIFSQNLLTVAVK